MNNQIKKRLEKLEGKNGVSHDIEPVIIEVVDTDLTVTDRLAHCPNASKGSSYIEQADDETEEEFIERARRSPNL